MENPTYKDKKDREYKRLAGAVCSVCNSLSADNITILSILSRLELGPLFSIRRTFSKDSMLKVYIMSRLKKIKSYRALVNYLRNRPEETRVFLETTAGLPQGTPRIFQVKALTPP